MNQLYRVFLIVCMASVAAACNRDAESDPQPERLTAVTIDCSGAFGVDVRTFIEGSLSNGDLEIGWDEADRFRLWASRSSDGTFVTSGADFGLYHYDMTFPIARFKGTVDLNAYTAGDTYNYYAVSPVPAQDADVNGTLVSYTLPAVQTGEFDGSLDILTAQLTNAPALAEDHNPDIRLQFQHQVHVLRITIPENRLGEDIRAMELSFPASVVGRLTVDATGASKPELAEEGSSSVVSLKFAEPKKVGDVVYVTIAPTMIPKDGVISMRIVGRTGETSTVCLDGVEREMAAGHFSPIELRVPAMNLRYTLLTFRLPNGLGVNTLGEVVNKVKITPQDGGSLAGVTLPDDSELTSTDLTYGVSSSDGRDYTIMLKPDVADGIIARLNGKALKVELESPRAWGMSQVLAGRNITLNAETVYDISVPYLLDVDLTGFSGSDGHDNPGYGWNSDTNTKASNLGEKINAKLTGWSGVNVGVQSGAIRTNCRFQNGVWVSNRYRGRIDTAPLARIKSKAKVKVNLEYTGAKGGAEAVNPVAAYGYTTDQSATINSKNDAGTGWLSTGAQQFPNLPTDGSYTSGFVPFEYTIADCTPQHRLTWEVNSVGTANNTNANSWLYIRNIRVSLANE